MPDRRNLPSLRLAGPFVVAIALAGLSVSVAAFSRAAPAQDANVGVKSFAPLVAFSGAESQVRQPTYLRATTAEEFQELWLRHIGKDPAAYDAFYNPDGVPVVDFDRCMVVAIFQGEKWNSAGVACSSVTVQGDELIIRFDDRSYQTSGPDGGGQRVTPFGIFVLPRSDRAVVLIENVQHLKDRPPVGREKARFAPLG